jgi:radical SAM superfamily enzyme YgiQ (UPF0313 family)/ubiquinone/menaquinone biosynthesis C-methylase UbiE
MPKREKILLINPKDSYIMGSPPLGLGYLISYARKINQNDVFFLDENFSNIEYLDLILDNTISNIGISFVGIGFPSSAIKRVVSIARYIKKNFPDILVFAGGYHPTSEPLFTLKLIPEIDFLVLGQAESTFAHLGKNWQDMPGIAYIEDGQFSYNNISNEINSLDDIPYIDRSIFSAKYFEPNYVIPGVYGKTATIMTSRGCPYSCFFCSNKLIQPLVKYHSIEYTLGEIDSILSTVGKIDYLFFLDVMFLSNWKRIYELCIELKKSKILKNVKWAATVSANVITEDKVKIMKESGCFLFCFGLESNSDYVLKLINKKSSASDNYIALKLCKKYGILANSAFLFGIPGESEKDLIDTLNFVKYNKVFATGINVMKPLPGSPFYYSFLEKGLIKRTIDEWYDISSIHHSSKYYNQNINADTYQKYISNFNKIVYFRRVFDDFRVNFKSISKYRLKNAVKIIHNKIADLNTTVFKRYSSHEYKTNSKNHWSSQPCGSNYSKSDLLSKEYFDEIEEHRYKTHPWIKSTIESFNLSGKNVLEIGFGIGSDHLLMARQNANMHGIDLTPRNQEITQVRLDIYGKRSKLLTGDAERLPFPDEYFDFVYSFGVIHHSPDTKQIINEIFRVLKRGGGCYVTVYNKNSIFFWWSTFFVNYILKRGYKKRSLKQQISLIEFPNNSENLVLKLYRKNEFLDLFNKFNKAIVSVDHLLGIDILYLHRFMRNPENPNKYLEKIGKKFGWYIIVQAIK